ncbi:MAG: adenylyl-sulfate kinase [Bacteroidota bacterium]
MENIFEEQYNVTPTQRSEIKKQQPLLIWFTGLSGSGKSTLAKQLEVELHKKGFHTFSLDGDNVRSGLNKNVGFTPEGRKENLRRIGEVAKLMIDAGLIVIGAFISPYKEDRYAIQNTVGVENYFEVFVDTPIEVCEERDVKGLYEKARKGEIKNFTGVSAPYESPEEPTVRIDTSKTSIEDALKILTTKIEQRIKTKN